MAAWLWRGCSILTTLVMLAVLAVIAALRISLPPDEQSLAITGLSAPVEITFDQDGVPRIRAGALADAVSALGYVHARDRMFQMDMTRRAVSGRLAEIIGSPGLSVDIYMRRLGVRRAAEADLAGLDAETRSLLAAYARGVNAWIAGRGRFASAESIVLGAPEPWQPVDCLLWAKLMGLYLSDNMRAELARLALAKQLSPAHIRELWPADTGGGDPQAGLDTRYADAAGAALRAMPRFPQPFTLPQTASNEWAVDGRHTASGAPLLAGDPHLAYGMPGIWYLVRIDLPDEVLAGATSPGAPFLVVGRNSHIGWTFTTTGADVQDVFEETPVDAGHYLGPDGPLPYELREERIHVRFGPDLVLPVRATRHGPVINDVTDTRSLVTTPEPAHPLAASMANLAPGDTAAAGLLALNRAHSVAEAGAAAALISAPVQNLLVADRAHIGLFVTGRVPVRRTGDGSAPAPGADGAHDWTGFASGDRLPHYLDPASGRLVNANERVAPADFPVFLGRDAYGDWRARRIRTMLRPTERFTAADFAAMQTDVKSAYAEQLLPVLHAVDPPDALARSALALLLDWDGTMAADRPEPLIFNAWMARFREDVLDAHHVAPGAASPAEEFTAYLLSQADPAASLWWCGGSCGAALRRALGAAVDDLAHRFGRDPAAWRWGTAHQTRFANQTLASLPVLGPLTTEMVPGGGDDSTVGRAGMTSGSFTAVHGAAYRGVYDLADPDRSRFVIAPGQSGNPISRHAWDFVARWQAGETVMLGPEPLKTEARLHLRPGLTASTTSNRQVSQ